MNVHNLSPIVYTCEAQMCLRSLFTCLLETACIKTNNTLKFAVSTVDALVYACLWRRVVSVET